MKNLKLITIILTLTLVLTSCSLAKKGKDKDPLRDEFVGALVVVSDNIDEEEALSSNINIELKGEGTERHTEVTGIKGHAAILYSDKEGEEKIMAYAIDDYMESDFIVGEEDGMVNKLLVNSYVDGSTASVLMAYPIYKAKSGKFYAEITGGGMQIPESTDDDYGIAASMEIRDSYKKPKEKDYVENVVVASITTVRKNTNVTFTEMDESDKLLNKQSFDDDSIPDTLKLNENTAYVVVEGSVDAKDSKRTVVDVKEESGTRVTIIKDEKIAELKYVELKK